MRVLLAALFTHVQISPALFIKEVLHFALHNHDWRLEVVVNGCSTKEVSQSHGATATCIWPCSADVDTMGIDKWSNSWLLPHLG